MHASSHLDWVRMTLPLLLAALVAVGGCARSKYRLQADHEAYGVIAERNVDPRWSQPDYSIELDPRSRYFDAYDPDFSPMPPVKTTASTPPIAAAYAPMYFLIRWQ